MLGDKPEDLEKHLIGGAFRIKSEIWTPNASPILFRNDHALILWGN